MERLCVTLTSGNTDANLLHRRTLSNAVKIGDEVVHLTQKEQKEALENKLKECSCDIATKPYELTGEFCNRTWDNIMCWGDTPASTTAYKPCPSYINNFRKQYFASRTCLPGGVWASHPAVNGSDLNGWTNYTDCQYNGTAEPAEEQHLENDVPNIFVEHVHQMRLMYNVGYAMSLASLVIAFAIMIYFRKLHCSRNTIHLNLFASFIFRAAISLIRDNFMVAGIGFPMDVSYNDTGGIVMFKEGPHWECRLFFALFQYTIAASHVWIFTEAVYLHMLIFVSIFTESIRVRWFILFGWLFPLVFVLSWCIARLMLDNTLCWNTHSNQPGLVWIIQSPIILTIVLNFIFFISIIRVLYTKLKSPPCPDTKKNRYRRLARSTLFLVPTFGVYYIIFTIPTTKFHETVEFVMLFIEMFFNSFQGLFIAVVLCFVNTEVRNQIKRSCVRSRWCPCCKHVGHTKTDYLRSMTHAESRRENGEDRRGLELGALRSIILEEDKGVNVAMDTREHEPFLQKTDVNYSFNGSCCDR